MLIKLNTGHTPKVRHTRVHITRRLIKSAYLHIPIREISDKGVIVIKAQNHRTQERNKQEAFDRLRLLLQKALTPNKYRRPSTPSYGSVKRRLKKKSERKEIKNLRKKIKDFE